jgi:hypothetical protein
VPEPVPVHERNSVTGTGSGTFTKVDISSAHSLQKPDFLKICFDKSRNFSKKI